MKSTEVSQKFSYLIDHLILQLSVSYELLKDKLCVLMASSSNQLFTDQFLSKIAKCKSLYHFMHFLLPFMTWLDHSILRELVEASKNAYAIKLLDQFDSMIDDFQPVTSFPIPPPGQLIIPLSESDHTLLATKYDYTEEVMSVKQVRNVKSLMEDKWNITNHALQLIAVCTKSGFLYWMIPECIVPLIERKLKEVRYDLWQCGFITIVLFPFNFYQENDCGKEIIGPFNFISHCDASKVRTYLLYGLRTFVCIYTCTHIQVDMHNYTYTHTHSSKQMYQCYHAGLVFLSSLLCMYRHLCRDVYFLKYFLIFLFPIVLLNMFASIFTCIMFMYRLLVLM